VTVSPSSSDDDGISCIAMPGNRGNALTAPGQCILVRAERPGAIEIRVNARQPHGSLDAEVRLERIALGESSTTEVLPTPSAAPGEGMPPSEPTLEILA